MNDDEKRLWDDIIRSLVSRGVSDAGGQAVSVANYVITERRKASEPNGPAKETP